MEEDWMAAAQPAEWRRQRAEDNFILANQEVTPTTDMETKIKVEELEYRGDKELSAIQEGQEQMRTDQLDYLRACRLLWLLLQGECGGGIHDRRQQGGDHHGDRRLEAQQFLDRGRYNTEDRVHRLFPGNQTSAERTIEQIWSSQIVKNRSDEHHLDEEEGCQFLCDSGSK
eukprot:4342848-Heterocapsa_arctica.AAC.1